MNPALRFAIEVLLIAVAAAGAVTMIATHPPEDIFQCITTDCEGK